MKPSKIEFSTYVLTESPDNISTLFRSSCILKESIHYTLLDFATPGALGTCDLDKSLINAFDSEGLRLSQRKALLFLGLESYVTRIAYFIVQSLESLAIKAAYLFERFRNGRATEPKLQRYVRWGYRVGC